MYLVKTPKLIQKVFPNFIWKIATRENAIFLSFDDGPDPEITPWVLKQLRCFHAKATFFCVGENILKYPEVLSKVLSEGHSVGSHTFNHMNAWNTEMITYLKNVRKAAHLVPTKLFRPPYGRLLPRQVQFLRRHYQIVMWDVLSGDFDESISPAECFENVKGNAGPGSIVAFHDNLKSWERLKYVLPEVLHYFTEKGFKFKPLLSLLTESASKGKKRIMLEEK
jgi:peptidoglycan/xylan/chitin deacetylase (PgdA/CDA1 family)